MSPAARRDADRTEERRRARWDAPGDHEWGQVGRAGRAPPSLSPPDAARLLVVDAMSAREPGEPAPGGHGADGWDKEGPWDGCGRRCSRRGGAIAHGVRGRNDERDRPWTGPVGGRRRDGRPGGCTGRLHRRLDLDVEHHRGDHDGPTRAADDDLAGAHGDGGGVRRRRHLRRRGLRAAERSGHRCGGSGRTGGGSRCTGHGHRRPVPVLGGVRGRAPRRRHRGDGRGRGREPRRGAAAGVVRRGVPVRGRAGLRPCGLADRDQPHRAADRSGCG